MIKTMMKTMVKTMVKTMMKTMINTMIKKMRRGTFSNVVRTAMYLPKKNLNISTILTTNKGVYLFVTKEN